MSIVGNEAEGVGVAISFQASRLLVERMLSLL